MGRPLSGEGRRKASAASALCAADAESQACLYARMLQAFPAPILIVVGDRLQFKNRAANRLMAAGALSVTSKGEVRFADSAAQDLFEKVRVRKIHSGAEILRSQGDAPAMIMQAMRIGRTSAPGKRRSSEEIPVVIFVTSLSGAGAIRKRAVDGFGMLSRTEKEVLSALIDGESVGAIAEATERSVATVRWHVKKMLTKTGARSIGDLTRIGSLLAPY